MYKLFIGLITVLFSSGILTATAHAQTKHARESAKLAVEYAVVKDTRSEVLEAYLAQFNSPFADKASVFVAEADKYDLDWRFVASISGIESTFGKRYPHGTYNAWGWGIYGTNMHYFASWDEAIQTISRELRERYMDTWGAQDVYQIGSYYAASPTWADRVTYFMNDIERFEKSYQAQALPILL